MTKLLYLITQSEFGGAQKYVRDLALNLPKDQYEVSVGVGLPATLASHSLPRESGEPWLNELENSGVKVWRLKHVRRGVSPWQNLLSIFEMHRLIKNLKPDVVHLNSSMIGFTGAVAAHLAGVKKIIYTVHGLVLNEKLSCLKKIIYWKFEWLGNLMTDKIICVSEYDKNSVLKYHLAPESKIIVIHNGINFEKMNFLEKEEARRDIIGLSFRQDGYSREEEYFSKDSSEYLGMTKADPSTKLTPRNIGARDDNNAQIIGCIANLYPTKGLTYLVEAAREIVKKNKDTIFMVIGEGQERNKLENLIEKNNLQNNFFLLGAIPQAAQYLKAFDIFVLPSVKEGLPYTLIEAEVAGLPIIATNVGGNGEVLKNYLPCELVPAQNPEALQNAILKFLDQKIPDKNIYTVKQDFALEKMIKDTEKEYEKE